MPQNFLWQLTGSLSKPAADNPSVEMVEAAYRHHGLQWRYVNFEVDADDLADAVRGMRALGFAGFNCSMPHKVAVIEHLDGLGESAAIIGAVNCVVRRDGKFIGENTDGKGFVASLREKIDPTGKNVVIFGAGGAARAIAVETALAGATQITVVNRSETRGRELAALVDAKTPARGELIPWRGDYAVPAGTDVVVNATSIGMHPDADARLCLNLDTLRPEMVIADVIANPLETHLIRDAAQRGCTVLDGLGMLVNQGVISIKYWTGVDADAGVMRARVRELFE
jgi:shikimate dehydrogenase